MNATADPAISAKVTAVSTAVVLVAGKIVVIIKITAAATTLEPTISNSPAASHNNNANGWVNWRQLRRPLPPAPPLQRVGAVLQQAPLRLGARQLFPTRAQITQQQVRSLLRVKHRRRITFPARGAHMTSMSPYMAHTRRHSTSSPPTVGNS